MIWAYVFIVLETTTVKVYKLYDVETIKDTILVALLHFDGLEVMAEHHAAAERNGVQAEVKLAQEDLDHYFEAYDKTAVVEMNSIDSPENNIDVPTWQTKHTLHDIRNAELTEKIWTMHTAPNIHVTDYDFFARTARASAYVLVVKTKDKKRMNDAENGFYQFWLRKEGIPLINERWIITHQRDSFVAGIPWKRIEDQVAEGSEGAHGH